MTFYLLFSVMQLAKLSRAFSSGREKSELSTSCTCRLCTGNQSGKLWGGGLGQTLIGGVQNQNQTSLTLTFQSSGNTKKQISALKFTHFLTVLLEFNKNVLKITISVISETGFVRKKSFKTSF